MIRNARGSDSEAICTIYNHYVLHSVITFEEQEVSVSEMHGRIVETSKDLPWLVFDNGESILGYAYASRWKSRCAYRFSVESTVYLSQDAIGNGIGSRLYKALIERLRDLSIHSIIGGIALPNAASVALHEKLGFEKVAHFKEVGRKMNRWIDVGYWEMVLQDAEQGATPDAFGADGL
ncbi:arsinothricin resistance N-acetyltransferase ArsN1 family B [Shewanella sp. HN-41]|uniref:arsinothricin resistance N-acetyltransferase ArsN1 family B n=1 Tax=Shewanella sp. HN-41 TaxID=327275 RepID=UPI0005616C26|nr:arsinothricin resistance N-acetyltransferase ArsN1 family B [Shewanella sp. HN-41]